jgi:CcmD family protein
MNYLVAAYIAIWAVLFVYLFSINARQRRLQKEVESLQKQLERLWQVTSDQ